VGQEVDEGYMDRGLTHGELFSGIDGFALAALDSDIKTLWASEIESFPIAVSKARFPHIKHLGDITKVKGADIEPVDIISGGFPCQDVSVAGNRAGLAGQRSGLFFEAIRIIEEMIEATNGEYPKFIIIENVPGLLSSNNGKDMEAVLDTLQNLGFIVDANILDAQYFGVPQRRRRVFITCLKVDIILQMKTPISLATISQLQIEILLCILNEQLNLSAGDATSSVWKEKRLSAGGLQRKMKLFSIEEKENFETLQNKWAEICQTLLKEQSVLEHNLDVLDTTTKVDIYKSDCQTEMEQEKLIGNILRLWRELLGELYCQENSSITSTALKVTTNQIIYGCANLVENIALLIGLLKNYYQTSCEIELFILTAREACISYARQTNSELFTDMEWVHYWNDYLKWSSSHTEQFEQYFRGERAGEILLEPEGVFRDIEESGDEGEDFASDVGSGIKGTGRCTGSGKQIASTIFAAYGTKWNGNSGADTGDHFVIEPAIAMRMREGCAGGGKGPLLSADRSLSLRTSNDQYLFTKMQPIPFNYAQITSPQNGNNPNPGDKMHTLGTDSRNAIAFTISSFGGYCEGTGTIGASGGDQGGGSESLCVTAVDCRNLNESEEISGTLQSKNSGGYSPNYQNPVRIGYRVRRLTPLECERCQGLISGWTNILGAKDSPRYKAIGNGIAIPPVSWIFKQIKAIAQRLNTGVM